MHVMNMYVVHVPFFLFLIGVGILAGAGVLTGVVIVVGGGVFTAAMDET